MASSDLETSLSNLCALLIERQRTLEREAEEAKAFQAGLIAGSEIVRRERDAATRQFLAVEQKSTEAITAAEERFRKLEESYVRLCERSESTDPLEREYREAAVALAEACELDQSDSGSRTRWYDANHRFRAARAARKLTEKEHAGVAQFGQSAVGGRDEDPELGSRKSPTEVAGSIPAPSAPSAVEAVAALCEAVAEYCSPARHAPSSPMWSPDYRKLVETANQVNGDTIATLRTTSRALEKAEKANARYRDAIHWALGQNGEFEPWNQDKPHYYWRSELSRRCGDIGAAP